MCVTSLLGPQFSVAQSPPQPAVVISVGTLGEQLKDIKHLVKMSGFGNLNFMIQSQVKYYTGGIDREKNSGAFLYFEGDDPQPKWLGLLAVDDADKVLDQIANFADIDDGDDFITITPDSGQEFLIKESDGYFLISDDKAIFDFAPSNPDEELGALVNDSNFAVKVFGQRVPEELRAKGIQLITEGFEMQMDELEGMDEAVIQTQLKQLKSFINETQELSLSYLVDQESKTLKANFSLTALEGSEVAKRVAIINPPGESKYTGFLDDQSAVDFNLRYQLHEDDIAMYAGLVDNLREQIIGEIEDDGEFTDEELAIFETASINVADCFKATLEQKLTDSGGVVMMDEKAFNSAFGSDMAETSKFEDAVKSLTEVAESKSGGVMNLELNSGTYDDITLHTFVFDIAEGEEEARKVFGSQVKLIFGVAEDRVYFGFGKDPLTTLTDAIERSKTPAPSQYGQLMYNIRVAPLLRFASRIADEEALAEMASTLETNNTGRITIWSKPIPNGIDTNIEIQDGILALIKEGFDAYQQGAFQGGQLDEF
jgi:hypothetical protein